MIPLILSIDFDFFIREDPKLDMGHGEHHALFFNELWGMRRYAWGARGKTVQQMLPWDGPRPKQFKSELVKRFYLECGRYKGTAESHSAIMQFLERDSFAKCYDVINFDAHHDISYKDHLPASAAHVDCGNWGCYGLKSGAIRSYTVVYPDWRRRWEEPWCFNKGKFGFGQRVRRLYWSGFLKEGRKRRLVDKLFLCRSGAWCPPCYDKDFNTLSDLLFMDAQFRIPERHKQTKERIE